MPDGPRLVFSSAIIPALTGITPQLVSVANLQRANALLRVGENSALLLGFALVGVLVAGLLADAYGPSITRTGCAALVIAATAGALFSPQVRRLRS